MVGFSEHIHMLSLVLIFILQCDQELSSSDATSDGARAALNLSGTVLGYYPVRVLPSKTAIAPVNPTFLPRVRKSR